MSEGEYRYGPLWNSIALAGVIAAWLVLALQWHALPQMVPAHTDLSGHVDRYGARWNLCVWPVAATFVFTLLFFVQRHPANYVLPIAKGRPARGECERLATGMLHALNLALCWMFAGLTLQWITLAEHRAPNAMSLAGSLAMIAIPLAIVGVSLVRMQRLAS